MSKVLLIKVGFDNMIQSKRILNIAVEKCYLNIGDKELLDTLNMPQHENTKTTTTYERNLVLTAMQPTCPYCSKGFSRKDNVIRHMRPNMKKNKLEPEEQSKHRMEMSAKENEKR
ncbi:hypothetical protein FQA39_LY15463 [Lamprigera yunnana]|nr:hypothetical protein FQA39_LY15463 [Lamprigera yunnana]